MIDLVPIIKVIWSSAVGIGLGMIIVNSFIVIKRKFINMNTDVFTPSRVGKPTAQIQPMIPSFSKKFPPTANISSNIQIPSSPPVRKNHQIFDVRKSKICVIPDDAKILQITSHYLNKENYTITIEYYDSNNNICKFDVIMNIRDGTLQEW